MFRVTRSQPGVITTALSLGVAAAAGGQASGTARERLDGYMAEALTANLAIAQQSAARSRANAGVREADGRFLPTVGLNAGYSEFSGVVNIGDFINPTYAALNQLIGEPRFPTNVNASLPLRQETTLELTQPLLNDAQLGAPAAARAQRDLAGATRRSAMRRLAADIQQAWLGYASTVRAIETRSPRCRCSTKTCG